MITKRQYLEEIIRVFTTDEDLTIAPEDIVAFCTHELELLDTKNEKSRAKSSATAKKNDELAQKILSVLNETPQTIAQVVSILDDEEASAAKVTYRLAALAKDGVIGRERVEMGDKKMCAYYLFADAE